MYLYPAYIVIILILQQHFGFFHIRTYITRFQPEMLLWGGTRDNFPGKRKLLWEFFSWKLNWERALFLPTPLHFKQLRNIYNICAVNVLGWDNFKPRPGHKHAVILIKWSTLNLLQNQTFLVAYLSSAENLNSLKLWDKFSNKKLLLIMGKAKLCFWYIFLKTYEG